VVKKLFDWTPRDIAYWEKIRQKGFLYFVGWYGVIITGGLLFLVFGLVTLFNWIRQVSSTQITQLSWAFLGVQLIFVVLVYLVAGIAISLITWVVEERLYRKYKARNQENP
jgi:membrane protease YdiL (CAAX protease family)